MNIEVAPISKNEMTYEEAILYCQFLEHNGCRDWRLPTLDEYYLICTRSCSWFIDLDTEQLWYVVPVRDV